MCEAGCCCFLSCLGFFFPFRLVVAAAFLSPAAVSRSLPARCLSSLFACVCVLVVQLFYSRDQRLVVVLEDSCFLFFLSLLLFNLQREEAAVGRFGHLLRIIIGKNGRQAEVEFRRRLQCPCA